MQKIVFELPLNSLSYGNVSLNILREAFRIRNSLNVSIFPIAGKIDIESFDKLDEEFKDWIIEKFNKRFDSENFSKESKTIKIWHLNGSEMRVGTGNQILYTFHETSEPTDLEVTLCSLQDKVVFSSKYSCDKFKDKGLDNIFHIPPGFDPDLTETNRAYLPNKIHFGLMGKWEHRKNTAQILKCWAKKYGNNFDYQLTCCVNNPFIKTQDLNNIISNTLEGKRYGNINFLPYLKTNSEVNDLLNSLDIDLTGLSGAEGWNLPSFNATALGKWSIVMNHTAHKDWATEKNCILVEPDNEVDITDGMFFKKGSDFNQGIKYTVSDEKIIEKMELSESYSNNINKEGKKLKSKFSYKKTFKEILKLNSV
jgi:hypothetical protein